MFAPQSVVMLHALTGSQGNFNQGASRLVTLALIVVYLSFIYLLCGKMTCK